MISLEEAKQLALQSMPPDLEISEVYELPDKWVFSFRNAETKEIPTYSPTFVTKDGKQVADFFPPAHRHELPLMKKIEG